MNDAATTTIVKLVQDDNTRDLILEAIPDEIGKEGALVVASVVTTSRSYDVELNRTQVLHLATQLITWLAASGA